MESFCEADYPDMMIRSQVQQITGHLKDTLDTVAALLTYLAQKKRSVF